MCPVNVLVILGHWDPLLKYQGIIIQSTEKVPINVLTFHDSHIFMSAALYVSLSRMIIFEKALRILVFVCILEGATSLRQI